MIPGEEFYLKAFWDLNTCRAIGFSVGPIPWNNIVDYAEWAGLETAMVQSFVFIIREMDAAYLKDVARQQKQETPKKPTKSGRIV